MAKHKYIAHGNFYRKTRIVDGTEQTETIHCNLAWIFDCPGCLYVFPFNRKEEAVTARKLHMDRCCPDKLDPAIVDDLFEELETKVKKVLSGKKS